jgi:SAM-dependent methyltransferase
MDTLVALLLARTVMAATAVGVFDALADGPLASDAIAARCRTHPAATDRLLRALYGCKYLEWERDRFRLAPVARRWLIHTSPQPLHAAILHRSLDLRFMAFEEYVRNGETPHFHDRLSSQDWELYHHGQAGHAALLIAEVVKRAPVPRGATHLLDVGGGHGEYAVAFCRRYRRLHARVLDLVKLPHWNAVDFAQDPVRDRVEFDIADIRTAPIAQDSCDVLLLANIVHHFDESTNRRLIQTAARALRVNGVLVVIDVVRPRSLANLGQLEALLDLYFGAASGVGLWSVEDIRQWMASAGLEVLPSRTMRRMPCCTMQTARRPSTPSLVLKAE